MLSFCVNGIVCKLVQKTCISLDGLSSFPMKQADCNFQIIIGTPVWTLYVYSFNVCEISLHDTGGDMRVSSG